MNIARLALPILMAFLSASSSAGEYTSAYEKQKRCEGAGQLAQSFFASDTKQLRAHAADLDSRVKKKEITRIFAEETKYILFLGNQAKSPKDAYMSAWSWCMDQKK